MAEDLTCCIHGVLPKGPHGVRITGLKSWTWCGGGGDAPLLQLSTAIRDGTGIRTNPQDCPTNTTTPWVEELPRGPGWQEAEPRARGGRERPAAQRQQRPGWASPARALKNGEGPSKGEQPSTPSHHFGHQVNSCSTEHRQLSFSLCQEALETLYEDN